MDLFSIHVYEQSNGLVLIFAIAIDITSTYKIIYILIILSNLTHLYSVYCRQW